MDCKKIFLNLVIVGILFVSVGSMVVVETVGSEAGKMRTQFAAFLAGPSANVLTDFLSEPPLTLSGLLANNSITEDCPTCDTLSSPPDSTIPPKDGLVSVVTSPAI